MYISDYVEADWMYHIKYILKECATNAQKKIYVYFFLGQHSLLNYVFIKFLNIISIELLYL